MKKRGPTGTWTRIAGFRVQSDNHYTIGPKTTCITPGGTRTHNLTLRRGAPCPLGHGGLILSWQSSSAKLRPTNRALNQSRCNDLLGAVNFMVWFSIQVEKGMGSTLGRSCWFYIFNRLFADWIRKNSWGQGFVFFCIAGKFLICCNFFVCH